MKKKIITEREYSKVEIQTVQACEMRDSMYRLQKEAEHLAKTAKQAGFGIPIMNEVVNQIKLENKLSLPRIRRKATSLCVKLRKMNKEYNAQLTDRGRPVACAWNGN